MTPLVPLRRAFEDEKLLGGSVFGASSWATWRAVLLATMGEALTPDELATFQRVTGGRVEAPAQRVEEALFLVGRRGGKDRAASVLATYIAGLCDHSDALAPGERGVCLLIAPDQRQATITLNYIEATFRGSPMLATLVAERISDVLRLTNGIDIEVRAASFRRIRGMTCVAAIASECAFWPSEDGGSSNADSDILAAVRPALATTSGPLILITTPYARRGEVWELYRRYYGPAGDPSILIVQGTAREFNCTLPQAVVDRALARDHAAASAEYLARFRDDISAFVTREAVLACVAVDVRERPPCSGVQYYGFVDPSGGSGDSMTLAVGHREKDVVIIDCLRERRPPFSPEDVVEEFCTTLKSYRVLKVIGDRYAGEWPRERFRERNVAYEVASMSKADLYLNFLPSINSSRVRLLDDQRLIAQLCGLERRTTRGTGRDVIDHGPGGHDDLSNCVAGLFSVAKRGNFDSSYDWVSGPSGPTDDAAAAERWQEQRLMQHIRVHSGYYQRRVW
jgi:hypothetical protein